MRITDSLPYLLLLLCLSAPACSLAHGLATTIPDHDAVLESSPESLRFAFQAQVTITNLQIEIVGGARDGELIDITLPRNRIGQSTAFGQRIELPLPLLAPSQYRVVWRAMSIDGHYVVDFFNFTISGD